MEQILDETVSWIDLAYQAVPYPKAALIKKVSIGKAMKHTKLARKYLREQGWIIDETKVGGHHIFSAPQPPDGFTFEEYKALIDNKNPVAALQRRRENEIKARGMETGRPILTWREMVILGWDNQRAMTHRGSASRAQVSDSMKKARQSLRKEGWTFEVIGHLLQPGIPPASKTQEYAKEIADAQQRSNWLLRLPANQK